MRDDGAMLPTRRALALAGVLTGTAGLVTSQATVWMLQARNGPVVAVSSAARDLTPGRLAINLAHFVGPVLDKVLLKGGTVVILVAICAWVGTQTVRRPWLSDVVYFVLGCIGLAAVLRLPDSTVGSSLGVVVGLLTWLVVHRVLTAPLLGTGDTLGDLSRRTFLRRVGGVGLGIAAAGLLGGFSSRSRRRVEQSRNLLRLPDSVTPGVEPAGSDLGLSSEFPWRTPIADATDKARSFYRIDTALSPPLITPADWRLRIHGMVDHEMEFSYNDLVGRQLTGDWVTLCCVSNEVGGDLIGNAYWSGVLIRDILAEVGIQRGADAVLQTSDDGWNCGTPLAALTDDRNAMLALAMNGEPLPIEHGFPVRMVVPGLYGFVSATKWLVDLEVTRFDKIDAYWTQRGWSEQGPVLTQSRIDVPSDGGSTKVGRVKVGGSAWAQHTGIERVEYQIDGGSWQRARLGTVPGADTWVQWVGEVEVDSGSHSLVVRATDRSGYTQTAVRTDVVPSGATGWHTVTFEAS